ncbi:PQQ-binding-like beta-propeller repeat protein [Acidianus sulfidivorans JP7]|uniref:PQQ-binding-like beta-propeller repeat protein n=1 Tax=Acidianus sulfidivorans TaxID=312539 RepID=UPI001442F5FF|nr:PQQ-binding-like beta-propeller repeat protein [Acidianus sulfidivorans]QIJ32900.1 PQQ-binding-like beta-propeller repeat protein [Acidianus sulfidivorans JP7]
MNRLQIISIAVIIGVLISASSFTLIERHEIGKSGLQILKKTSTITTFSNTQVHNISPKVTVIQTIPENSNFYNKNTVLFENSPSHVYFLPIKTGYFLLNVTGAIIESPSVYGNLMIVTTSGPMINNSLMFNLGCVYAINDSSGKIVWEEEFQNQIMTQPIIVNGILIIGLGNNMFQNSSIRGTGYNAIIALNVTNGKVLWIYQTLGEDMPTPAYYKGMIIEANGNGDAFALNITNGKLIWNTYIQSYVSMSSMLLVGDVVYFGSAYPYVFWAINANNGHVLWEDNFTSMFLGECLGGLDDSSPSYSNGIVVTSFTERFFSNNTIDEFLVAMNSTDGHILWMINEGYSPMPPNLESPPSVIYKGIVFHDSPVGILYAVNLTTGAILWKFYTGFTTSNVDIARGKILIQNRTGTLFVLSLNGTLIKEIETPVSPGPGNIIVTYNSIILVGVNGIIDVLPIQAIRY